MADLRQLTGKKFNARAFRRVPIQIFRGAADDNDEVAFADGYDEGDRDFITGTWDHRRRLSATLQFKLSIDVQRQM